MFSDFYKNRRVMVTGHTGFKGSWLCEWLLNMGAEVCGYALDPQAHEILYDQLRLGDRISSDQRGDVNDLKAIAKTVSEFRPEVILHLAAQPLVRLSYDIPVETFATNVMGTAHLLEAVRLSGQACTVVCVTTDKCYENREWLHAYREEDAMGGHDPYSASKGAAEIVISSYRRSFFSSDSQVYLASARAGNVIGGGDWALDRIVPECIRAIRSQQPIRVRNKISTRPWQHVLEPLSGYLHLAASLATAPPDARQQIASAFNFGPTLNSNRTVAELVEQLIQHTGGQWIDASDPQAPHEASKLNLAVDKAFHLLNWQPVWSFADTIMQTAKWYTEEAQGASPQTLSQQQILHYQACAHSLGLPWSF